MGMQTKTGEPALARIDGWGINVASPAAAVSQIVAAARRSEPFAVVTLNLDHIVKLRSDAEFRRAYETARFVTADGAPIAALAARQYAGVERTTGADLVMPLCGAAAREKLPVYLFGTSSGVLATAGTALVEATGHTLDIAGSDAPPHGFDPRGPEADRAIDRIAASGARLCFVALGAPKQEIFSARAVERGVNVGFVCIGAALDFLAGRQRRAPAVMRRYGFEWLWRLGTDPRRLGGRYARCALVLGDLVIAAALAELRGADRLAAGGR
jgi:exopolysaccharide biosynthesis WecB/TagA/CpsF family protein